MLKKSEMVIIDRIGTRLELPNDLIQSLQLVHQEHQMLEMLLQRLRHLRQDRLLMETTKEPRDAAS